MMPERLGLGKRGVGVAQKGYKLHGLRGAFTLLVESHHLLASLGHKCH